MLLHDREEIRESLGGGDILRVRVPVPEHLIGKPANPSTSMARSSSRGSRAAGPGASRPPTATLQAGDYLVVMMVKDGLEMLDQQLEPTSEHH